MTNKELQYDIDALKNNVSKAENNIKLFEDAIVKEMEIIRRLKYLIKELESRGSTK